MYHMYINVTSAIMSLIKLCTFVNVNLVYGIEPFIAREEVHARKTNRISSTVYTFVYCPANE